MIRRFTVGAIAAAATGLFIPSSVSANEIALTLPEQDITITGTFTGFENQTYLVLTKAGVIYVPAGLASCAGVDCRPAEGSAAAQG